MCGNDAPELDSKAFAFRFTSGSEVEIDGAAQLDDWETRRLEPCHCRGVAALDPLELHSPVRDTAAVSARVFGEPTRARRRFEAPEPSRSGQWLARGQLIG